MATDKEIITQFLTTMSAEIKARIPKASGRTGESLEVVASDNTGQLLAAPWIGALEMGRKPTGSGAGASPPTLRERILQWIKDKNITPTGNISQNSLAFLIARSIHRHGTLLYRAGGYSGVLSDSFSEARMAEIAEAFAGKYQAQISSQVFEKYTSDKTFKT